METRLATKSDAEGLVEYFSVNREHFQPWEPIRAAGYYSLEETRKRLAEYEKQHTDGVAAHFIGLIDSQVVSHCSLTNIIYGPLRGCFMGYGVSREYQGSGVMTEVCQVAIDYAFKELGLNRIMANYMPVNVRSGRLLEKLGFVQEGVARKYLKINGVWEDHVLASKLNPEHS